MIYFVCNEENDLFRAVKKIGNEVRLASDFDSVVSVVQENDAILVLADNYPRQDFVIEKRSLNRAIAKGVRLYIEYPKSLPSIKFNKPRQATVERAVITSEIFTPKLPQDTILDMHSCWFLPTEVECAHLYISRVAGYNKAVFGLSEDKYPLLFNVNEKVMVSTSKLSGFVNGRYAPHQRWVILWEQILYWLNGGKIKIEIEPVVSPRAEVDDILPVGVEQEVFHASRRWFWHHTVYSIDKKKGVIEGLESEIQWDGHQRPRIWTRADCLAETAMVFAYDWAINQNPASYELAYQILNYTWTHTDFVINNPESPAYGLLNWYERGSIFYGDDNARAILASIGASSLLGEDKWLEPITRCLLANLRTTGALGFRRNKLEIKALEQEGWRFFHQEDIISLSPHYQAYLWAANLWLYALTKDMIFFDRTYQAIEETMEVYPRWKWTNGFSQELARMLLPLAYLLKIEDNPKHRRWMDTIVKALTEKIQPSGGIHEFLGDLGNGQYPSPQKNEDYGTTEASLIQDNGDPACDLLYTNNFAFLGFHEAAAITNDENLIKTEDKLAKFFCRIQARSRRFPELDGAWMRSFDDELWEYWGSSADLSWGVWCAETGWTNSWIASVLAMRILGQTLFSDALAPQFRALIPQLKMEMLGRNYY